MIHNHLIAKQDTTPLYATPEADSTPVATVVKDSWLGEVERKGNWVHVIGIDCEGWVKLSDVEMLPPMGLHAVWRPGKAIAYMRLSNAS